MTLLNPCAEHSTTISPQDHSLQHAPLLVTHTESTHLTRMRHRRSLRGRYLSVIVAEIVSANSDHQGRLSDVLIPPDISHRFISICWGSSSENNPFWKALCCSFLAYNLTHHYHHISSRSSQFLTVTLMVHTDTRICSPAMSWNYICHHFATLLTAFMIGISANLITV